jgi:iron complex outermembrane receptor protein
VNVRFSVGPKSLLVAAISLAFSTAYAQDNTSSQDASPTRSRTDATKEKKATNLEAVVVSTGTRTYDRTVVDSLAPIDVLTSDAIKATAAPDLATALRTLLPSLNFPQATNNDLSDASRPAQLRGLSPDEVLVLVNGKRIHTTATVNPTSSIGGGSSPVNLNAIPVNAISRIEVLRDGAAAQYGSDAIAGVINIILKDGADHGSVTVTHGVYNSTKGDSLYGKGNGSTWQEDADGGFKLGSKGWVHMSASLKHQGLVNRAGADLQDPGSPTYGKVTFQRGLAPVVTKQGMINLQYDLTPNVQLYGYSLLSKSNVYGTGLYRSQASVTENGGAPALAVYPNGFLPHENSSSYDDTEVLGVRGSMAGWRYDISADAGGNRFKYRTANTFNYSLGSASPTAFYIGTLINRQYVLNADFSKSFHPSWLPYALNVAWGLTHQVNQYQIKQGEAASYAGSGPQVFGGYTPLDAGSHSRHNDAAYIDLEADLTDKLSVGIADRQERYSDFGNTNSGKLSARYAFTDTVALRGTVSNSFLAPSLQQQYYSSTGTLVSPDPVTGQLFGFVIRNFPVSDPAAIALGAQPLKPEKSRNYSLGLVLSPSSGLFATLDLYQIHIDNRILLSGQLTGDAVTNYLSSVGIPFVSGGDFFTNAISTTTRGADLVVTYPMDLGSYGSLTFSASGNYNKTQIDSIKPNPPQLGLAGLVLPVINRQTAGDIIVGAPRTKGVLGARWDIGNWGFNTNVTRYGSFTTLSSVPVNDQTYPARYLLDVSGSYTWRSLTFTLGADNVTNVYPRGVSYANSFFGNTTYPAGSPFGMVGAYYYGRLSFDW